MTDTLLQFGGASAEPAEAPPQQRIARSCPACQQLFSSDARFCPFDGEALIESGEYDPGADPLLGSVVDHRYEIQRVLGEGGMGIVYCVRHVALGKCFALKALRADLSRDGEIAERFIGEARTAAGISHPGLVEITDFGTMADGRPYFVMELLEGQPLSWFIRKGGAIPVARAIHIARQVAEAVGAAHHAHVVHRDLKPDNVYVMTGKDGSDRVKVLDFGLAKVMGGGRRTREGVVFGTPHYMSPEQAAGESVDHRADIYSLGIVMYELLTGRVPFEADSFMGVLSKHIYMQPTPPSQVLRSTGEIGALEGVVLKCLEKKPKDRYQSFDELLVDLDQVLAGVTSAAPPAPRPSAAAPSSGGAFAAPTAVPISERLARVPLAPLWPVAAGFGLVVLLALGFVTVRSLNAPAAPPAAAAPATPAEPPRVAAVGVRALPPKPAVVPAQTADLPQPAASSASREPSTAHKPARASTALQPTAPVPTSAAAPAKAEPAPARQPRKPAGVRGEIVDPWGQ